MGNGGIAPIMDVCGQFCKLAALHPWKNPPRPHGIGGWVHPRISLDTLLHHLESNNSFSTVQTLAYQASVITISITLGQKIYADI